MNRTRLFLVTLFFSFFIENSAFALWSFSLDRKSKSPFSHILVTHQKVLTVFLGEGEEKAELDRIYPPFKAYLDSLGVPSLLIRNTHHDHHRLSHQGLEKRTHFHLRILDGCHYFSVDHMQVLVDLMDAEDGSEILENYKKFLEKSHTPLIPFADCPSSSEMWFSYLRSLVIPFMSGTMTMALASIAYVGIWKISQK